MTTKRKHHEVTLKVKYEALKELEKSSLIKALRTSSVFLVVLLLLGRKTEKKSLKLFKIHHWNDRVKTGTYEKLNEALLVTTFQSMVLFFWRKLMNLLRPSITTILQHRTDGCSNGCSSLACTILYIVKKHPLLIFLKCGSNNLNSYNSKTHVIRTNFESPWGFEFYEFNCIF